MNNLYWHYLPDDGCLRFGTKEKVKVKHTLMLPPDSGTRRHRPDCYR